MTDLELHIGNAYTLCRLPRSFSADLSETYMRLARKYMLTQLIFMHIVMPRSQDEMCRVWEQSGRVRGLGLSRMGITLYDTQNI